MVSAFIAIVNQATIFSKTKLQHNNCLHKSYQKKKKIRAYISIKTEVEYIILELWKKKVMSTLLKQHSLYLHNSESYHRQ